MLDALVRGTTDPEMLADLARGAARRHPQRARAAVATAPGGGRSLSLGDYVMLTGARERGDRCRRCDRIAGFLERTGLRLVAEG
jgi:hypothetical protein